jgi:uncharacterized Zn finger protein
VEGSEVAVPKITDAKIKGWLGATYAQRGLDYYRNSHVVNYQWSGEKLTGRVQGSEYRPYRVTILFEGQFLDEGCSCPMGGGCKHVAALLYAVMNDKSAPSGSPSKTRKKKTPALSAQLEKLDKPDLINLLNALLAEDPDLTEILQTRLLIVGAATLPPEKLRDHVRQLVDRIRPGLAYDDESYGDEYAYADDEYDDAAWDDLAALVERAKTLIAEQRQAAAQSLLSALLDELMLVSGAGADDDELLDLMATATKCQVACWQALQPDDKLRAAALRQLFEVLAWDISFGGSDLLTLIEKALVASVLPAERDVLREWIALASRQAQANRRNFSDTWTEKTWAKLAQKLAGDKRANKRATGKQTKRR